MKKSTPASTVDDYLAALPDDVRACLDRIRAAIKSAAPKADEIISYQMPAYKYHGMLVYFAAFKNHCSFFPGSKAIITQFANDLAAFETNAGTIRFTLDHPLPATLVKKIVKARMKENELRAAKNK